MDEIGKVLVYDATTYALKNTIPVKKHPAEVTFSFDGSKVFVANGGSDTITVINPNDKSVLGHIAVGEDPVGAWTGSDGKMYVDNEHGQSISILNTEGTAVEETIELGFMPGMAAFNAAVNELWVSDPNSGKAHYWSKVGNLWSYTGSIETGSGAHAIAFSSNGHKAYITNQAAGTVSVVNVTAHSKEKDLAVGAKPNGIVIKD